MTNTKKKKRTSLLIGFVVIVCGGALLLAFDRETAKKRIDDIKKTLSGYDEED